MATGEASIDGRRSTRSDGRNRGEISFPPTDWKTSFQPRDWNFVLIRVMDCGKGSTI